MRRRRRNRRYVKVSVFAYFLCLFLFSNLKELNIPDSVEVLELEALLNIPTLRVINIGSGIKSIDENTFRGLRNQDTLTININLPENAISGSPFGASGATVNWLG